MEKRTGDRMVGIDIKSPTPLRFGIVKLEKVIKNKIRLDASSYNFDVLKAIEKIKSNKYGFIPLWGENGVISDAYYPGRYKRIYVSSKKGTPFYMPSQLDDILPKPTKYVSALTVQQLGDDFIKEKSLLLSRSGTIGKSAISSAASIGKLFSDDVIRVTFKHDFDLGYTYAFLKTDIGLSILQGNIYGSVIDHIEPEHLNNIPIPNAPQAERERINNLIDESYKLRDTSNELIISAQDTLHRELRLPPLSDMVPSQYSDNSGFNNFSVKLSQTDLRFDGSYHLPIVNEIEKRISENSERVARLGDTDISEKIILPGRFKRVYVDKAHGIPFFGGKQLLSLNPSNMKYLSSLHHGDRIEEQLFLKENMIAISCSGTIGKVMIVPKHWEGWTMNQHVIRIVPSTEEIAGYIYAWAESEYCKPLIERYIYGSVIDEVDDLQIANVPIPIIRDKKKLCDINQKVLNANTLRYAAYQKEQEAFRLMEAIIDGVTSG